MVKIFIGNLPREADKDEIQALFSQYGAVTECAIVKNFAFVHMDDRKSATKAIRSLHLYKLHGTAINVEASHGKNQGAIKLHVTNVEKGNDDELRTLFEEYGTVSECAIVKNFAFVHMDNSDEALDAIKGLDNVEFQGKRIHVQISKSRPRRAPYPERAYERERQSYAVVDYYEKYRARPAPYGIMSYDERRVGSLPPPPPPPSSMVRERFMTSGLDPYERRPLHPPPSAYYARDRSPIRRAPPPPMPHAGTPTPTGCHRRQRLAITKRRTPAFDSRFKYFNKICVLVTAVVS
ncbi:hypothetical protein J4Q44_G00378030 [Coregonus suidteri]|uniref:RRM domain-containing protein n=1 Tax=Coregonus suidteri TaxID=861788 RepID=A0AAN8KJU2_9TELE